MITDAHAKNLHLEVASVHISARLHAMTLFSVTCINHSDGILPHAIVKYTMAEGEHMDATKVAWRALTCKEGGGGWDGACNDMSYHQGS